MSILSGAHTTLVLKALAHLEEYDALADTLVIVGGIISDDELGLREVGVDVIFGSGVSINETLGFVRENVPEQ